MNLIRSIERLFDERVDIKELRNVGTKSKQYIEKKG